MSDTGMDYKFIVIEESGNWRPIEFDSLPSLADLYREIGCEYVEVLYADRGSPLGGQFEIWCDEEGMYKQALNMGSPALSMLTHRDTLLFGRLFLAGPSDRGGDMTSLTDDQIAWFDKAYEEARNAVV